MKTPPSWLKEWIRLFDCEKGTSLVEYAMLTILIAVVAFTAVALAGTETSDMYFTIADSVQAAGS